MKNKLFTTNKTNGFVQRQNQLSSRLLNGVKFGVPAVMLSAALLTACKTSSYQVPETRSYSSKTIVPPPGMVYVPSGTVLYKADPSDSINQAPMRVSLSAFFMDATEVTNKQYREFVDWVADSVAITDYLNDPSYFKTIDNKESFATKTIDWSKIKDGEPLWLSNDAGIQSKLMPMLKNENGRKVLNPDVLKYSFTYMKAGGANANQYVTEKIPVMPDNRVWATDFPNSQMQFMVTNYYTNRTYDNNPVVGVTWKQARAFTDWRTKRMYTTLQRNAFIKNYQLGFNLPTEAQWEYAVSGVRNPEDAPVAASMISTGRNNKLSVNFKQGEGTYSKDGSTYTLPVKSYAPNNFGLYNMVGNVAEWTLDAFSPSFKEFVHDLNPVLQYDAADTDADIMKRKVVRGGSWKDPAELVNGSTREYEIQDAAHSYIGFRCVMPAPEVLGEQVKTSNRADNKPAAKKL
ncbi:MAG: Sulphatase-modifying factor protein [Sphingobacteriaceae bacterium]|nr:Sulphatase-modifying factor protein [Sphingobacteriaceae bacterium]